MSLKKWIGVMTCLLLLIALGCSSSPSSDTGSQSPSSTNPGSTNPGGTNPGGTNPGSTCGNGALDSGEECDGSNLNSKTCQTQGFQSGTLSCNASCKLNASGCTNGNVTTCGNGTLDSGEECEGSNLNGKTCLTQGFQSGTLSCSATCTLDTTGCIGSSGGGVTCGNGKVDYPDEDCDGTNLDGATCQDVGFTSGTLSCDSNCWFDTSKCTGKLCGNGKIDTSAYEDCDGTNLNGKTCKSLGYTGGTLTCDPEYCEFVPTQCTGNPCGNGKIDPLEDCEGTNLGGETCQSLGFTSGTLSCDPTDCWFNVDACVS